MKRTPATSSTAPWADPNSIGFAVWNRAQRSSVVADADSIAVSSTSVHAPYQRQRDFLSSLSVRQYLPGNMLATRWVDGALTLRRKRSHALGVTPTGAAREIPRAVAVSRRPALTQTATAAPEAEAPTPSYLGQDSVDSSPTDQALTTKLEPPEFTSAHPVHTSDRGDTSGTNLAALGGGAQPSGPRVLARTVAQPEGAVAASDHELGLAGATSQDIPQEQRRLGESRAPGAESAPVFVRRPRFDVARSADARIPASSTSPAPLVVAQAPRETVALTHLASTAPDGHRASPTTLVSADASPSSVARSADARNPASSIPPAPLVAPAPRKTMALTHLASEALDGGHRAPPTTFVSGNASPSHVARSADARLPESSSPVTPPAPLAVAAVAKPSETPALTHRAPAALGGHRAAPTIPVSVDAPSNVANGTISSSAPATPPTLPLARRMDTAGTKRTLTNPEGGYVNAGVLSASADRPPANVARGNSQAAPETSHASVEHGSTSVAKTNESSPTSMIFRSTSTQTVSAERSATPHAHESDPRSTADWSPPGGGNSPATVVVGDEPHSPAEPLTLLRRSPPSAASFPVARKEATTGDDVPLERSGMTVAATMPLTRTLHRVSLGLSHSDAVLTRSVAFTRTLLRSMPEAPGSVRHVDFNAVTSADSPSSRVVDRTNDPGMIQAQHAWAPSGDMSDANVPMTAAPPLIPPGRNSASGIQTVGTRVDLASGSTYPERSRAPGTENLIVAQRNNGAPIGRRESLAVHTSNGRTTSLDPIPSTVPTASMVPTASLASTTSKAPTASTASTALGEHTNDFPALPLVRPPHIVASHDSPQVAQSERTSSTLRRAPAPAPAVASADTAPDAGDLLPGERGMGPGSTNPAAAPADSNKKAAPAGPDIDDIVDRAMHAVMTRLSIERERRGFGRWA